MFSFCLSVQLWIFYFCARLGLREWRDLVDEDGSVCVFVTTFCFVLFRAWTRICGRGRATAFCFPSFSFFVFPCFANLHARIFFPWDILFVSTDRKAPRNFRRAFVYAAFCFVKYRSGTVDIIKANLHAYMYIIGSSASSC